MTAHATFQVPVTRTIPFATVHLFFFDLPAAPGSTAVIFVSRLWYAVAVPGWPTAVTLTPARLFEATRPDAKFPRRLWPTVPHNPILYDAIGQVLHLRITPARPRSSLFQSNLHFTGRICDWLLRPFPVTGSARLSYSNITKSFCWPKILHCWLYWWCLTFLGPFFAAIG